MAERLKRWLRKNWRWLVVAGAILVMILVVIGVIGAVVANDRGGADSGGQDGADVGTVELEKFEEVGYDQVEVAEGASGVGGGIEINPVTGALPGGNCTTGWGKLMLVNPIFTVGTDFIAGRAGQLIDLTATYGINESNVYNGRPLMDAEAGAALNEMMTAYTMETGGVLSTMSCFRAQGTTCGRLCFATGTSDHHTGYTCDLIDARYGTTLNTDLLPQHPEWSWLKANSYKYGFIDRFPAEWAGGTMAEPINMTEDGSTGLYESWHYRYVGRTAAAEIATGAYNGGRYDSLEHYLKAKGWISSLTGRKCQ